MAVKNHFDDCPYNCNAKGLLLDTMTGNMVDCPHCSKLKKEMLAKGEAVEEETDTRLPLADMLGIKSKYLSKNFIFDAIIPEDEALFLEEDSIEYVKEEAEDLYKILSLGELPTCSYCFGLSIKGRVDKFAYPMLAIAYLKGLSVGKFITCSEMSRLQLKGDDLIDEFYNVDLLMVMIGEGSTKGEISSAKGIMQARALKGKPTIFLTTWTIEACSLMLGYANEDDNLLLAKPVFVKYRNSGKSSNYINKLTGVENERYNEDTDLGGQGFSIGGL